MNKLKHYRNSINATQKDVGDAVGVSQSTIDRYESGTRKLNTNKAWALVDALNHLGSQCSFSDVFPNPVETSSQDDQTLNP
jgi:putative transcriptional regulator